MRVAIDAMGGDHAPGVVVRGALQASRTLQGSDSILLVGDKDRILKELSDAGAGEGDRLRVVHASQVIEMDESPAIAVRRKRDSSINRAMDLVKSGEADAFVSAGNTGAVVSSATVKLRLLKKVERPAIATLLPTRKRPVLLLDAGAVIDCNARMLTQFAVMGTAYAKAVLQRPSPLVGLLSIGGEETKGNEITKKAYALIDAAGLNFRGNVEGHDLFRGETDVVVSDGFVGNVVLKTAESVAHAIGFWMKQEFTATLPRKLGALMLRGALKSMKARLDPEMHGGAPLLGVRGVCIIAHGSSSERAIYHAIRVARESVHQHLNETIENHLAILDGR